MRNFFFFVFFCVLLAAQSVQAQSEINQYNLTTTAWASKYQLDEGQQAQALKIAERKEQQLNDIESLMTTNPNQYYAKLDAVQRGTLTSLRKVLNTPEQIAAYQKTMSDLRTQRAALKKQLRAKGASKSEIKHQLIRVHAE